MKRILGIEKIGASGGDEGIFDDFRTALRYKRKRLVT